MQQLTGHTSAVSACSFGVGGSLLVGVMDEGPSV